MRGVQAWPARDTQANSGPPLDPAKALAAYPGRPAYAAQALGLVFYVLAIWLEVYLDTRKAATAGMDTVRESHRRWRLRSSLLFFTWTILGGLTLPFGFGLPVLLAAWLWFAARVTIGWFRWERGLPAGWPGQPQRTSDRQGCGGTLQNHLWKQS